VELQLSEDQQLFQETTRRYLETTAPLTTVRQLADDEPDGFGRDWWRQGAELGWAAMLVPEEFGGGNVSGEGLMDLVLVAEEFGRMVSPGPLIPVSVVAAALAEFGTDDQRQALLPGLVAGETIATWALAEPGRSWLADGVTLAAERDGGDLVVSGVKGPVEAAGQADQFLVTLPTGDGLTLAVVPSDAPGLSVTPANSLDLVRRFGQVRFDGVRIPAGAVLGEVGGAAGAVERLLEIAVVLQCAEMVGATDRVFQFTLEYAFDRFSFGRPLASYQALKHRFADMKLALEASHATAGGAARAVQARSDDAAELVSVAKSYIGDKAPAILQDCVQMHGGIGVTWDHDLHLYIRRVTQDRALFGTPAEHRERIATFVGL
jgi:alkylation response protein AidB-like acyl-CoA dehydrogenase